MGSLVLDNGVSLQWEAEGLRLVRVTIKRKDGTGLNDTISRAELKRLMKDEIKRAKEQIVVSKPKREGKKAWKSYAQNS